MLCHHTWHQSAKDVVSVVNGVETTRYTHQCPHCGKVKVTVRASRKLPPELKWRREVEKLVERAAAEGYAIGYGFDLPLVLKHVRIEKHETTSNTGNDRQAAQVGTGPH